MGSSASGSLEEEFRLSVGVRALSGEGMKVLARCAEAAVDSPLISVITDQPSGLPEGRGLRRQGLLRSHYPTVGKRGERGEGAK